MSDQGEVAPHIGAEGTARHSEPVDGPTGPMPQVGVEEPAEAPFQSRFSFSDEAPKNFSMADAQPVESAAQGGEAPNWFAPAAPEAAPEPAPQYGPEYGPEHGAAAHDGPAFDGVDSGDGQSNYAGVDMSGPAGPVKAGVPSSGNWQMPDWMRPEAGEAPGGGFNLPEAETGGGKGKVVLFAVIGLVLVVALAAAAMFFLKSGGKPGAKPKGTSGSSAQPSASDGAAAQPSASQPAPQGMADTPLQKFPGAHSKAAGRIDDTFAGLSYPKLGAPWQVPAKKSGLVQPGWSGQQIVVTEKHGNQIWYGQLMSGLLGPAEQDLYKGPGTEHETAVAYEQGLETRLYGFPHNSKPIASQALDLAGQGGKGWLVSSELSYHRDGIKATGEIVTVAIIDTGKKAPAVLFMSVPNTEKKLMPDINFVMDSLKVAR